MSYYILLASMIATVAVISADYFIRKSKLSPAERKADAEADAKENSIW